MSRKIFLLLLLLFYNYGISIAQILPAKTSSDLPPKEAQVAKLAVQEKEIEILRSDLKNLEVRLNEKVESIEDDLKDRLNLYLFFIGVLLTIIGWAVNFFGKRAVQERVEELIKDTSEIFAKKEIERLLKEAMESGYISKIVREKGDVEVQKLLTELESKGKNLIEEIRDKSDKIINSMLAAPPSIIKPLPPNIEVPEVETITVEELFNMAFSSKKANVKINIYQQVLERQPNNINALNNLAVAYNDVYRYDDALIYLNRALELRPESFLALSNRANSYSQLGKLDLALADSEKAIELNPTYEWPYSIKGNVLTKKKAFMEAERALTKAIELNPMSAIAYYNRAYFMEETKRYAESQADYNEALRLGFSNVPMLYNNMAVLLRRMRNFDGAIEYINKAKAIDANYPNLDGTLALIYADRGETEDFYRHLQIALENGCHVWKYLDDYGFDSYREQEKLKLLIEPYKSSFAVT
ncbi:hypothetical protein GCM10011387_16070 [Pedobacter quisquiliarum]|uniref:Tetratricopeptide repeat-containing protein n=1 Tax=Pedobacter quisquiliarum TaxID=1834438 RepID=A0A916U7I4_9SPHI|nr:tetratricopeptide repeat protein [Pedobacter quisquiliarum]GGC63237.1 hypothetical protein GCM10011387_16070 [Pedobacter quisquiliarum]